MRCLHDVGCIVSPTYDTYTMSLLHLNYTFNFNLHPYTGNTFLFNLVKFALVLIANFYFQSVSGSSSSFTEDDSSNADAYTDGAEQPHTVHIDTVTVPTTTARMNSTKTMPTKKWEGETEPQTPCRKSRRLATMRLTPMKKLPPATTTPATPVTVSAAAAAGDDVSPLHQDVKLDGPKTLHKEPQPMPTLKPTLAVASTSFEGVGKKRKRGRPKKATAKQSKTTETTLKESDTTAVEGGKEPSKLLKKLPPATTRPTTPVTVSAAAAAGDVVSPLQQDVQLDGPKTLHEEPQPMPTLNPTLAVASTSCEGVGKKRKRGRPKKAAAKESKTTEATLKESDTTAVEGGKEPSKPEQTTLTTTTAASVNETVVPDESPVVDESRSSTPLADMDISKVGQASAAYVDKIAALVAAAAASTSSKDKKKHLKEKKSNSSDTDSFRKETDQAIENMAKLWSEPIVKSSVMPTPAVVVDDDKLWGKLLVDHVSQIKDKDVKENFKQHVNIIALQAVCGTWHVSQANCPSRLLSMLPPAFLSSPAKQKFPLTPSAQLRPSADFSGWSNVGGQARIGQVSQQMGTAVPTPVTTGIPMGSMHSMGQQQTKI